MQFIRLNKPCTRPATLHWRQTTLRIIVLQRCCCAQIFICCTANASTRKRNCDRDSKLFIATALDVITDQSFYSQKRWSAQYEKSETNYTADSHENKATNRSAPPLKTTCFYLIAQRIKSFENKLKQSFKIFRTGRCHENVGVAECHSRSNRKAQCGRLPSSSGWKKRYGVCTLVRHLRKSYNQLLRNMQVNTIVHRNELLYFDLIDLQQRVPRAKRIWDLHGNVGANWNR